MMVRNNMSRNLPINAFASQRGMGLSPRQTPRRTANRRLVDVDHFIDEIQTIDRFIVTGQGACAVDLTRHGFV